MNPENDQKEKLKCDACRNDFPLREIRYMPLKTCCSIRRIPLCRDCYDKFALNKKKEK